MTFWLSKRLCMGSVLVLWLVAACSANPNPPTNQPTLAGIWLENTAKSSHCDTENFESQIKLELSLQNEKVTGPVTMTLEESNTELKGNFSGTQNDKHLTGVITFSDQRKWNADLNLTATSLEGNLTDQTEKPCASSGSDFWKTEVAFLREVTEPVSVDNKEPNNSATQATPIQIEDSFNLSLSPNDIDWFKFSLEKPAEVQFDVILLNAMGLRAVMLNEAQDIQNNLESNSSSLTTQANSWQIKTQLPAGNYFLVITGFDDETLAGKHQDNGRYTLSFISSKALPDDASEPNDTANQATPITLDFSKEYYLGIDDQDWFSFTLSTTQLLEFSLQAGPDFTATLYNQNSQDLVTINNFAAQPFSKSLSAGKYYLKLARGISQGGYYTLGIKANNVPDAANEPNNTFDTATLITLDYEGSSYLYAGDEDWYRFNLSEPHLVTFDFGNYYMPERQLFDANQTDIGLYYHGSMTKYLSAGSYYLRLWNDYDQSIPLKISSVAIPDKANEPNNAMATATPITLDYSGSSYLYVGDEDWYTFSVNQNRLVTFDFGTYLSINIQLFDAQGNTLGLYAYSDSKTRSLGPGSYYLHLSNTYSQDLPIIPITINTAAPPDHDLEPNNSLNNATAITLPFSHEVYTSSGDEDWYTFSLNTDFLVNYQLSSDSDRGGVNIEVYNGLGQHLTYLYATPGLDNKPVATYLKSGQYYLKVYSESGPYQLNINKESLPDNAFEPNDSIEQAYAINVGFDQGNLVVYALEGNISDRDYFKFSLDNTTQLDIRLETHTRGSLLSGNLIGGNGNYIYSLNAGNPSDVILPAGVYILQISPNYPETSKYRLSVKLK